MISGNKATKQVRNFWFRQTSFSLYSTFPLKYQWNNNNNKKKITAIFLKQNWAVYQTFCLFVGNKWYLFIRPFIRPLSINSWFSFSFLLGEGMSGGSIFLSSFFCLFFKSNLPIHITFTVLIMIQKKTYFIKAFLSITESLFYALTNYV